MGKKGDKFNPVFKGLESMIKVHRESIKDSEPEEPTVAEAAPEPDDLFNEAMEGITPLADKGLKTIPEKGKNLLPSNPMPNDKKEGIAHLKGLVKGTIEMDIIFSDEYVEGALSSINPKIMKQLKQGKIPVQDHIDLHGFTKQTAETEVRNFILNSFKTGKRCVLIVHGRGLNSPDSLPVLKERLPVWLNRGAVKRVVLAFATARPYDGGTGAIYVLLRKR